MLPSVLREPVTPEEPVTERKAPPSFAPAQCRLEVALQAGTRAQRHFASGGASTYTGASASQGYPCGSSLSLLKPRSKASRHLRSRRHNAEHRGDKRIVVDRSLGADHVAHLEVAQGYFVPALFERGIFVHSHYLRLFVAGPFNRNFDPLNRSDLPNKPGLAKTGARFTNLLGIDVDDQDSSQRFCFGIEEP